MRVIGKVTVIIEGQSIEVEQLEDGKFRKPAWLQAAERTPKRIEFSGNALMRHGGDNTRPWMEEAAEKGYHELPGDAPACPESEAWDGWGTALKPAWEPVLVGHKPG